MANLETLELTISATSESASKGIDNLVDSLTVLRNEVGKNIGALVRLNREIDKLKHTGRLRFSSGNKNVKRTTQAIVGTPPPTAEEILKSQARQEELNKANASKQLPYEAWKAQREVQMRLDKERIALLQQQREAFAQKQLEDGTRKATAALKTTTNAIKETSKSSQEAQPKVSGFAKSLSMVERIVKTMLIRTALRSLIKSFSETWSAAYEYSKKMGGEFARNVENARGAIASISTNLITTFAPALNALTPIINTITVGINYLCTLLQRLFNLLGMGSDLFGVTAGEIDKYAKSSGGGAKATKNLLASFDELNVIQSTGSGGGASGSSKSFFADMVSENMARVNMIVASSMLGIGLILACTGHIGVGVGLMAIGAASIAKTMFEDWNKLPNKVKKTIAEILIVTGVGMLAVGMIALCAGNIPLGIGMLALGATAIGIQMFVGKDEPIGSEVRRTITEIAALASVSLMAVGLIVAIAGNVPLGLGMIIAGAATWMATAAYDPNGLVSAVNGVLNQIGGLFEGLWSDIKRIWEGVATWFNDNVWTPISNFATDAWTSVSSWWTSNITEPITKAWESVTEFFRDLFGSTEVPGSIADYANDAWISVSSWWGNIIDSVKGAWDSVSTFFSNLFGNAEQGTGIAGWASGAWKSIKDFWQNSILGNIQAAWAGVLDFFNSIFEPIKSVLSTIWDFIKDIFGIGNHKADYELNVTYTLDEANSKVGQKRMPFDPMTFTLDGVYADGGYGIPRGDLFIANEQGAELVGSMNGKTTVANQNQIIEGIQSGVRSANESQNMLLREQNELLRKMLNKSWEVTPNATWGKFNQRSQELWAMQTGR